MGRHGQIADSVSDRRVAAALRLLHRNLGDHALTLSAIAVSLSVSTSRLRHLVKLETGVCFSEHLNKARVRAAAGYLFDTSLSVKEVAFLVGYYNIWALDRHFKAVFGCTPKVYRAQQRRPKSLKSPAYPRCEMDGIASREVLQ
jgi:transcriptional regulator GlxA family with amidase domain